MSANLVLGVRLVPSQFQRIKVSNINLEDKVEVLKSIAATRIQVNKDTIELVYCGRILDDGCLLSSYGVKSGVMVHVLERAAPIPAPKPPTEADIDEIVASFARFRYYGASHAALTKLADPERLETIIAATPSLARDPVALLLIRDTGLIVQLSDAEVARRIAEKHPAIIEAAPHIIQYVREETMNIERSDHPGTGHMYSMDALSDDDDMDSSSSDTPRDGQPLTRNSSSNAITAAQLAAAIASATNNLAFEQPSSDMGPPTPQSNLITAEMFNSAIQNAFSTGPSTGGTGFSGSSGSRSATTPARIEGESYESLISRFCVEMQQMREMGLTSDGINIRALQTTSGDLQAAVELVLSGAFD